MLVDVCRTMFGEAEIRSGTPDVREAHDCVFRPFSGKIFFDHDHEWGVYEDQGAIIPEAAYRRGPAMSLVGQSATLPAQDGEAIADSDEECIYFGPLIPHYGHFIISSLARMWHVAKHHTPNQTLICHSDHAPDQHFSGSFMGHLLRGLGLEAQNFRSPKQPTCFRKLIIPDVAFFEQKYAYDLFLDDLYRIGDSIAGTTKGRKTRKAAYFSKSKMTLGAVTSLANEPEVEELLREAGIDVYYPEKLSFVDQIRIFGEYEHILGFAGSAFHTHAFVREPPRFTCATFDPFVNSNFIMLDRLNNVAAQYLYPQDNIQHHVSDRFPTSRSIVDPQLFVSDLLEAAGLPRRKVIPVGAGEQPAPSSRSAASMSDGGSAVTDPPLDVLKPVAPDLWIVDSGPLRAFGMPLPVRMTVVRLAGGGVWLHSPTRHDPELQRAIEALGPIRHLVAPNVAHWTFLGEWQTRCPQAQVWAAPNLRRRRPVRRAGLRLDHDLGPEAPPEWAGDLRQIVVPGALGFREVAFHHGGSGTLILTDLVLNLEPGRLPAWMRPLARLIGITAPDGRAPAYVRLIVRLGGAPARRAAEELVALAPQRVVFAHGAWFAQEAAAKLRRSLRWLLPRGR